MTPRESAAADDVRAAYGSCTRHWSSSRRPARRAPGRGCPATHITGSTAPKSEWLQQIQNGEFTYHAITDALPIYRDPR